MVTPSLIEGLNKGEASTQGGLAALVVGANGKVEALEAAGQCGTAAVSGAALAVHCQSPV